MSTTVVCAQLNLLSATRAPSAGAPDCKANNVVSAAFNRPQSHQSFGGGRGGYAPLVCQAATGGSRRDYQKIVARTQKRRARHVKGVTPSTPDLLNQLESEKQDQIKLDAEDLDDDEEEYYDDDDEIDIDDEVDIDDEEEAALPEDEAAALPPAVAKASYVGDKYEAPGDSDKGLGDRIEETVGTVAGAATGQADDADTKQLQKSGRRVGDDVENIGEEAQKSSQSVAGATSAAIDAGGKRLQKAGRRVGGNLDEVRKDGAAAARGGAGAVDKQVGRAADNIQDGVAEAGDTVQDLAAIAQDAAAASGRQLRAAGNEIGDNLEEIGDESRKVLQQGGDAAAKQARRGANELGRQVQDAQENTDRAVRTTVEGAQRSADRVRDPIAKVVDASLGAASAIGDEVFRFGDVLIEAAEQATGMAGAGTAAPARSSPPPKWRSKPGKPTKAAAGKGKKVGSPGKEGDHEEEEEGGPYAGLKVLVAGATGRTGRLIVENLVGEGASVRALVRDVYKARNVQQLRGAELVEGDLYKYETIKEALGDSNVVICAVGAPGFDLLQTYRTEYEGVLNLISAAKNQGHIKKFVFITTIGVNYLQVIPLLYWKRQAELFLQRSGLDYTIVRPAGLTGNRGNSDSVELKPADSLFMGAVSRSKVAEVCLLALVTPSASEKVVEVVNGSGRVRRSIEDQFERI